MTREETEKILAVIAETYPMFLKGRNPETTAHLWQMIFADDPYEAVEAGLAAFVATDSKGFPPMPGNIKQLMHPIRDGEDENSAWALVLAAIRRSGWNAGEEFDKLPADIQRIIGGPETLRDYSQMDSETVNSVIASNFRKTYRDRMKNQREMGMLPAALRARLPGETRDEFDLLIGGEG